MPPGYSLSGGGVGRSDFLPDRESVGHLGLPLGRGQYPESRTVVTGSGYRPECLSSRQQWQFCRVDLDDNILLVAKDLDVFRLFERTSNPGFARYRRGCGFNSVAVRPVAADNSRSMITSLGSRSWGSSRALWGCPRQ